MRDELTTSLGEGEPDESITVDPGDLEPTEGRSDSGVSDPDADDGGITPPDAGDDSTQGRPYSGK